MLAVLTSLKPFVGETCSQQLAAIESWLMLDPRCRVIVYGKCDNLKSYVDDPRVIHHEGIATSVTGVPLFNDIVRSAEKDSESSVFIYVNGDIQIHKSAIAVIDSLSKTKRKYLGIGRRIDLEYGLLPNVNRPDIISVIDKFEKQKKARLHPSTGSDYFIFPRSVWSGFKGPIVIGRAGYDNALIAHCLYNGIDVIDCTGMFMALHPEHHYSHVLGGKAEVFSSLDAKRNMKNYDIAWAPPTVADADYELNGGMTRKKAAIDCFRRLEIMVRFKFGLRTIGKIIGLGSRVLIRLRLDPIRRRKEISLHQILDNLKTEHESVN